jgi:hypothetical protein
MLRKLGNVTGYLPIGTLNAPSVVLSQVEVGSPGHTGVVVLADGAAGRYSFNMLRLLVDTPGIVANWE